MSWFRKASPTDPLAVTMTGVKLGDRLLVIGLVDTKMIAALAAKAGLTGSAVVIDPDAPRLRAAVGEIEREGGLVEATHAPLASTWPYDDGCFDVAVLHDVLRGLSAADLNVCLAEVFRTLRAGGRAIVIDGTPRRGFGALVSRPADHPTYAAGGDAVAALKAAGFAAVRILAQQDGIVFTEGAKRSLP
jgi:ubiquinone/menaquinone biosynthesis C-methylase UbiE